MASIAVDVMSGDRGAHATTFTFDREVLLPTLAGDPAPLTLLADVAGGDRLLARATVHVVHRHAESAPAAGSLASETETGSVAAIREYRLAQNAPNPFTAGASTRIAFELPRATAVNLAIYGLDGRLLRVLASGALPPGRHELRWDGRDRAGVPAAPGLYFMRLEAGAFVATRRVTLLR